MNELLVKLDLISLIKSLILGGIVGSIFAIFKLRPPAPDQLAGIFGIFGIFIGWWIVSQIIN
jgi:XapX domain-containing protein